MTTPFPSNSFTDEYPSFPCQSSEARMQLGIPDVPAIHLAITELAEALLALSWNHNESAEHVRIFALRCASYGVLMKHSFEAVKFRFRVYLSLPMEPGSFERAESAEPVDWLSNAIARLGTENVVASRSVRQQATPYGWTGG